MKKGILGALAGISLAISSCVTITPKGSIDIAYIPMRCDDKVLEREWMAELDAGLELKVVEGKLKDTRLRVGGRSRTYMGKIDLISYSPTRQEYDCYGELAWKNIKLYAFHMCAHPVKEVEHIIQHEDEWWFLNHDDISKIGVKFEW